MDSYGYLEDFQWGPEVVQKRSGVEERDFHDRARLGWAEFDVKASSWADLKANRSHLAFVCNTAFHYRELSTKCEYSIECIRNCSFLLHIIVYLSS
jgi:hypothetical protein